MSKDAQRPMNEQVKRFEVKRKMDLIMDWLALQAQMRSQSGCYGRMVVELSWEGGAIKRATLTDTVIIEDLTEKERELLMRAEAGKKP